VEKAIFGHLAALSIFKRDKMMHQTNDNRGGERRKSFHIISSNGEAENLMMMIEKRLEMKLWKLTLVIMCK